MFRAGLSAIAPNSAAALAAAIAMYSPFLYAQAVREFPVPTSNAGPVAIVSGPDGALWFTENLAGKIGRVSLAGQVSEFPLGLGIFPRGLTAGSDGAIWWASDGGTIGRITMAGQVSVFPIPGALDTGLIATDFEGSLWFFGAFNEIVRRAADGTLSVFTVPTPSPALGGLCRGPDGKMWFTVSVNGYKIDNITSAGLITEFDAHTTTNMPSMALGADDALWFTQTYSSDGIGRVGRVTTAGSVTQYPVPGKPFGITSGPDGALWYTDAEGAIGRLSVSGMATRIVTLRPSSDPQGITVGPDGAIWFTEREGFIGRLGVTVAGTVEIPGVSDAGLAATAVILAIGGATFLRRS